VSIVRGRKKTLVKDAPRPSPGTMRPGASKKVARTRGDLMTLPIAPRITYDWFIAVEETNRANGLIVAEPEITRREKWSSLVRDSFR